MATEIDTLDIDGSIFSASDLEAIDTAIELSQAKAKSLLKLFRKTNILSVTDLSAPTWCEVQYEYGLRQKRSKPLQHRSSSFTTASGKEIVVDHDVALKNDRILSSGKAVHKKLEQELCPVVMRFIIESNAELWGLRLLEVVASLAAIPENGCAREIPVFGSIGDQLITGVVDELRQLPRDNSDLIHPRLRLIDTKTRKTSSLPTEDDTLPSRIQLMIYKMLLDALLDTCRPFDFLKFWERLELDATAPFSDRFIQQADVFLCNNGFEVDTSKLVCLFELGELWTETVHYLGCPTVDPTLQLIYRYRPTVSQEETIDIIGTKEFIFDEVFLKAQIHETLQWWRGERKPVGVTVKHCGRCNQCEYKSGCEWREQKALELAQRHRNAKDW